MTTDNRREHQRVHISLEGQLRSAIESNYTRMLMANLSLGGAYIRTEHPLDKGQNVELTFTVNGREVSIEGEVVWVRQGDADAGMGIRFLHIDFDDIDAMRALIETETESN
ncbi:MAG: hypothetical protein CMH54_11460 [Myxococcales bacterium]|nr:hypothetical protein [Myxococcales bacterium]|tara:strand:- start:596 stop:928 length:333 start_codon:yes stop_codon:yes gene_type:complete